MTAHLFSLVLASATGWAVLALGYLPIPLLREQRREPLLAIGAWIVVSATAPAAVFHWYLILAVICFIVWTRLDRPAGKVWLAIAGSLGLSIGLIFPLELSPELLARENPFALASLYLGGATAGLAYVAFLVARTLPETAPRRPGFARALVIAAVAWTALLGEMLRLAHNLHPRPLPLPGEDPAHTRLAVAGGMPFGLAIMLVFVAIFAFMAARRNNLQATRWFAGTASGLALVTSLLAQFFFR